MPKRVGLPIRNTGRLEHPSPGPVEPRVHHRRPQARLCVGRQCGEKGEAIYDAPSGNSGLYRSPHGPVLDDRIEHRDLPNGVGIRRRPAAERSIAALHMDGAARVHVLAPERERLSMPQPTLGHHLDQYREVEVNRASRLQGGPFCLAKRAQAAPRIRFGRPLSYGLEEATSRLSHPAGHRQLEASSGGEAPRLLARYRNINLSDSDAERRRSRCHSHSCHDLDSLREQQSAVGSVLVVAMATS